MFCSKITVIVNDLKKVHGNQIELVTMKVGAGNSAEEIKKAKLKTHGIIAKDKSGRLPDPPLPPQDRGQGGWAQLRQGQGPRGDREVGGEVGSRRPVLTPGDPHRGKSTWWAESRFPGSRRLNQSNWTRPIGGG